MMIKDVIDCLSISILDVYLPNGSDRSDLLLYHIVQIIFIKSIYNQ